MVNINYAHQIKTVTLNKQFKMKVFNITLVKAIIN